MVTVIAIILADVVLFLLYVYQYRQELGLSVNGSHDLPVVRKKTAPQPPAPAGEPANRGRQVVARR